MLAWVGIVIGIPGFLLLFVTGQIAVGVVVVFIVAGLIWFRSSLDQPEFTLLLVEKTLSFTDPQGHRAAFVRVQKARANHKGLREFWIGNMSVDGSMEDIRIDGRMPDYQQQEAGDTRICKRFSRPLNRGEVVDTKTTYFLIDSFPNNPDKLLHTVAYKTKMLRVRVNFHSDRPCRNARIYLRYGSQIYKSLPPPRVSADGCDVEFEVKRPKLGAEYCLEWEW